MSTPFGFGMPRSPFAGLIGGKEIVTNEARIACPYCKDKAKVDLPKSGHFRIECEKCHKRFVYVRDGIVQEAIALENFNLANEKISESDRRLILADMTYNNKPTGVAREDEEFKILEKKNTETLMPRGEEYDYFDFVHDYAQRREKFSIQVPRMPSIMPMIDKVETEYFDGKRDLTDKKVITVDWEVLKSRITVWAGRLKSQVQEGWSRVKLAYEKRFRANKYFKRYAKELDAWFKVWDENVKAGKGGKENGKAT
jgi:hypothetical protein